MSELENLYGSYESVEASEKPDFLKKVVNEIRELREHKQKLTTEAERPLSSLGPIRAEIVPEKKRFEKLNEITTEFYAEDFFAKTFTIEHK